MGGISLPVTEDLVNDDADHEKLVVKAGRICITVQMR